MNIDKPLWNDALAEIFSAHLSVSKYSLNNEEGERLCNVTPLKSNKIAPKEDKGYDRAAWPSSSLAFASCSLDKCKHPNGKFALDKDAKLEIIRKNGDFSSTESQLIASINVEGVPSKAVWGGGEEKLLDFEALLYNNRITKRKARPSSRSNRREEIRKKVWVYLPHFLITVSTLQICLSIWEKGIRRWLVYSPSQRHQLWRFATYALMHSDVMHLMLNVFLQIIIGASLEVEQGRLRCALVYAGGCVAGAMGASVLEPMLYICGSSGGVYAMLMSHVSHVWLNRRTLKFKKYRLAVVGVLVISDAAYTIAHWLIYTNTNPTISWPAHGVGAISGALIGVIVYKGSDRDDLCTKAASVLSTVIIFVFIILTILFNLGYIVLYYD